jgi:hypothetical protein
MGNVTTRITTDRQTAGYWRVILNHPPINTIDDRMYDEFYDLVEAIEAEPWLKVVTFEGANPDFFLAHYGVAESSSRFGKPRWIEAAIRLTRCKVLSIAVVRGRARGGRRRIRLGLRHPLHQSRKGHFRPARGQVRPHSGWRSSRASAASGRALPGNRDRAWLGRFRCRYGGAIWLDQSRHTGREIDGFVANFVRRILSFDKQALSTAKTILNQTGLPDPAQLQSTQTTFGATLKWPAALQRMGKAGERGLGTAGEFELDLGRQVGEL